MTEIQLFGKPYVIVAETHQGARGKPNEDRYGHFDIPVSNGQTATVLVVADGVTSTQGGAQASEIAVRQLQVHLNDLDVQRSLSERLAEAVKRTNRDIVVMAQENPDLKTMSTTLVIAAVHADMLQVIHLGDSRAYLLRGDQIYQLTLDHTWVQEAIDEGRITAEEAKSHPNRHVIQRFLGGNRGIALDATMVIPGYGHLVGSARQIAEVLPLQEGDALLLCSDGLYGRISEQEMYDILRKFSARPEKGLQQLVGVALKRDEPDNITALLMTPKQRAPLFALPMAALLAVAAIAIVLAFFLLLRGGDTSPGDVASGVTVDAGAAAASMEPRVAALVEETVTATAAPTEEPAVTLPAEDLNVESGTPLTTAADVIVTNTFSTTVTGVDPLSGALPPTDSAPETEQETVALTSTPLVMSTDTNDVQTQTTSTVALEVATATGTPKPTSTPLATSTPMPTVTATPTQVVRPTATSAQSALGSVVLIDLREPSPGASLDGSGRQPFEWDPIPGGLPQNFLYELVFWEKADANPLRSARSPVGAGEATRVLVDLGAADGRLDHVVDPGQDTCWGVRLWNTSMNRPEQMLSDSCRLFTYTGTGGQGAGSETGGVPSGGRN